MFIDRMIIVHMYHTISRSQYTGVGDCTYAVFMYLLIFILFISVVIAYEQCASDDNNQSDL